MIRLGHKFFEDSIAKSNIHCCKWNNKKQKNCGYYNRYDIENQKNHHCPVEANRLLNRKHEINVTILKILKISLKQKIHRKTGYCLQINSIKIFFIDQAWWQYFFFKKSFRRSCIKIINLKMNLLIGRYFWLIAVNKFCFVNRNYLILITFDHFMFRKTVGFIISPFVVIWFTTNILPSLC